jgi:DNA-directed RNA polymerase subunit K/omega
MANDAREQVQGDHGKYITVNALSRRIRDLHDGYKPLVNRPTGDLTAVAMEELKQKKLHVRLVPAVEDDTAQAAGAKTENK